jgi:hypothetical protein
LGGVLKKIGWPWDLHFLASLWQNKVGIVQHFCGAVILVKERSLAGHKEGGGGGGGGVGVGGGGDQVVKELSSSGLSANGLFWSVAAL